MENVVIILVFVTALTYLGRIVCKQFFGKNQAGCAKGCGSCQTTIPE